jgi:hypothetical protein
MSVEHRHTAYSGPILVVGVIMIVLSAFGVEVPIVDLGELGVGVSFASFFRW